MKTDYNGIRNNIKLFTQVVGIFSASLETPIMDCSGIEHYGFRYTNPTAKHFCALKAVRVVSGLNAAVLLAEEGFNQEVCVLIRTIVESASLVDFILVGFENDTLAEQQQKVVSSFFNDCQRNNEGDFQGSAIRQEDIHKEISRFFEEAGIVVGNKPIKTMLSNIYKNFSNFIHGRYPE